MSDAKLKPRNISVGKRFGNWTVIARAENDRGSHPRYQCKCLCGKAHCVGEAIVLGQSLVTHRSKSCGGRTPRRSRKHYLSATRAYWAAGHALYRCTRPSDKAFSRYGGSGIGVWSEWRVVARFAYDLIDQLGLCPQGWMLDRINPFGDYNPKNVRWVDTSTSVKNQRHRYSGAERERLLREAAEMRKLYPVARIESN